jgi:hypothetical protein
VTKDIHNKIKSVMGRVGSLGTCKSKYTQSHKSKRRRQVHIHFLNLLCRIVKNKYILVNAFLLNLFRLFRDFDIIRFWTL